MSRFTHIAVLFAALAAPAPWAIAQETPESSDTEPTEVQFPPRGNSEFIGTTTTARITRQFEMYNPHSKEELQRLKDMGFTQVILDWPNLHREANEVGLDVVLANWWTENTPQADIDRAIGLAKQVAPGRLAGISVMDEPERNSPDTPFGFYIDLYEQLRPRLDQELPGVRLEISHWGPLSRWDQRYYDYFAYLYEAADVMRIMPYPDLDEGPLDEVYLMMLRSRELMKIAGRELPLLVILQTWTLPPESKLPTIDELRVMAYQAMLGGAETLSFFDYNQQIWEQSPGFHDQFVALMCELTQLSHRYADATIESSLSENGILRAKATWPTGRTATLLVNTKRSRVDNLEPLAIVECLPCEQFASVPRACTQTPQCTQPCYPQTNPCRARRSNKSGCNTIRRCFPRLRRIRRW